MNGHTKGPWHVERDEEQYPFKAFIDDDNGVRSDDGRNYYLATVEHGSSAELEANARLIAAAPELLEALKGATAWMEQEIENIGGCDHAVGICCCGDKAQLASYLDLISKAEAK